MTIATPLLSEENVFMWQSAQVLDLTGKRGKLSSWLYSVTLSPHHFFSFSFWETDSRRGKRVDSRKWVSRQNWDTWRMCHFHILYVHVCESVAVADFTKVHLRVFWGKLLPHKVSHLGLPREAGEVGRLPVKDVHALAKTKKQLKIILPA